MTGTFQTATGQAIQATVAKDALGNLVVQGGPNAGQVVYKLG